MNLSYFRTSAFPYEQTVQKLKSIVDRDGWKYLGVVQLPNDSGSMHLICRPDWVEQLIKADYNLVGFLPCAMTVLKKDGKVLVGTGQTAIIKSLAGAGPLMDLAAKADSAVKSIIHETSGTAQPKVVGVKLYSTVSCPYCKMEKSWLDEKKIAHEVIYVDQDQAAAEEIVRKTGQMGVPVTEVLFDASESEFIVGFDRARLAELLGV